MQPQGRCNGYFEPERQSHDKRTYDKDHENSGPIAAILRAEIEIAIGAPFRDRQQATKKPAGAAARATASQSCRVGRKWWEGVRHPLAISRPTNRRK